LLREREKKGWGRRRKKSLGDRAIFYLNGKVGSGRKLGFFHFLSPGMQRGLTGAGGEDKKGKENSVHTFEICLWNEGKGGLEENKVSYATNLNELKGNF